MLSPKPPDCPAVTVSPPMLGVIWKSCPTPDRATLCGLPGALSVMVKVPERLPPPAGIKVMLMVQAAPVARLEPQVLVSAKSAAFVPETTMPEIARLALPVLVSLMVWAELAVPAISAPSATLLTDRLTSGPTPVPARATVWTLPLLPLLLSVIVSDPVRLPGRVGVNVTLNVQVAPIASVEPHELVSLKSPVAAMLVRDKEELPGIRDAHHLRWTRSPHCLRGERQP